MDIIKYIFIAYFAFINLVGFLMMGSDKSRAKKDRNRIPESSLFLCAALGGMFGSFIGMLVFRHKTKHIKFLFGMPALCVLWIGILFFAVKGYIAVSEENASAAETDYSSAENWAYSGIGEDKEADVFLICPTVDTKDEWNMSLDDEETKASFLGALNMERGIYEEAGRLYAPYYSQISLKTYELEADDREEYLEIAYEDISDAFTYYLENWNDGRPIILAGFSQGADMCYRLMEEYFGNEALYSQLVAVYAIGWPLTEEMTEQYPQLKCASGELDTGVVISFECESESVTESFIVPEGTKMLSINPLNWKTDSTPASKQENQGACFTNYDAEITSEIPQLCGAYIDAERGTLKVTDIDAKDYPAGLELLPEGAYHVYDYQFFFRNLQENVNARLEAYLQAM